MRYEIIILLVFATVVWAFARGAGPERGAALVLLGMYVLDPIYHALDPSAGHYRHVDPGHLLIDLAAMAGFLTIALKANRVWPLWAAAAQLLAVMSHLLRLVDHEWTPVAYASLIRGPSYIQIVCIACGIWMNSRRTRLAISIAPWLDSSSRSSAWNRPA